MNIDTQLNNTVTPTTEESLNHEAQPQSMPETFVVSHPQEATYSRSNNTKLNPLTLVSGIILMCGLAVGVIYTQKQKDVRSHASNTGTKLSILPALKTIFVGHEATLSISIATNDDTVTAAHLELSYDPTAIEQIEFIPNQAVMPVILKAPTAQGGVLTVDLGVKFGQKFKGTNVIGSLKVKPKTAKTSNITFTANTQVAALGKKVNALASSKGTTITSSASSTSPSQTPKKTPTPTIQKVNCSDKCVFGTEMVKMQCRSMCTSINTGAAKCPSVCDSLPSNWIGLCVKTLCSP